MAEVSLGGIWVLLLGFLQQTYKSTYGNHLPRLKFEPTMAAGL